MNKRGMEAKEIVKILIVVVVLALLIGATFLLLFKYGGQVLAAAKNLFRFGGA